jgi:hypothetical protein
LADAEGDGAGVVVGLLGDTDDLLGDTDGAPGVGDPTGSEADGEGPQMMIGSASYFVCR